MTVFRALALTIAQVIFLMLLAKPGGGFAARYLQLNNWDSEHYRHIAENGYVMPGNTPREALLPEDVHRNRANVAYFPAYPLSARALAGALRIPTEWALLLSAQLFAWLFWFYVLSETSIGWAALIAFHPAAFFLVTGYSESLFMAALLGFVLFSRRGSGAGNSALAAAHGVALTATRIVGAPLVILPVIDRPRSRVAWLIAGISSLGILSFFAWSQMRFGEWDLYLKLQKLGWGNDPNYLAFLDPGSYLPRLFFEHTVDSISRAANPFMLLCFWLAWRSEKEAQRIRPGGWRGRVGTYALAFLLFFIAISGKANAKMDSMIRYTFPSFVLMVLALGSVAREAGIAPLPAKGRRSLLLLGCALALATQAWLAHRFLRGYWAA